MACQPPLMAPGALAQASIISSVGSRIAAMAAQARAKDAAVSSNGAVPISCWSACATRLTMVLIDLAPPVQLVAQPCLCLFRRSTTNGSYSWGIDEIAARTAQQFFHFLDGSANCTANHVVQLDLALQLNDNLICEIETLRQDCRNV